MAERLNRVFVMSGAVVPDVAYCLYGVADSVIPLKIPKPEVIDPLYYSHFANKVMNALSQYQFDADRDGIYIGESSVYNSAMIYAVCFLFPQRPIYVVNTKDRTAALVKLNPINRREKPEDEKYNV